MFSNLETIERTMVNHLHTAYIAPNFIQNIFFALEIKKIILLLYSENRPDKKKLIKILKDIKNDIKEETEYAEDTYAETYESIYSIQTSLFEALLQIPRKINYIWAHTETKNITKETLAQIVYETLKENSNDQKLLLNLIETILWKEPEYYKKLNSLKFTLRGTFLYPSTIALASAETKQDLETINLLINEFETSQKENER